MILMKQMEGKKRNDERERKKEELRIEKERERERKLEQKRLETEIVNEMRKPVEDMAIPDMRDIPELSRIPNLRLSGEAFANILMVYEFLHNFGERLGFDMESLPTLSTLQAALLHDEEAEEELLAVVIHLLVCAIDDPGIPTPHKHLTLLGQNLRQADITNTNVSEILKLYLIARGQLEVKNVHGIVPPETHSLKDRTREIPFCKKKMDEFVSYLEKTRAWEMSNWVKERPFLCLNPTEKAEILAFVCNELLFNKSVLHQIESNVERVNKAKKIKLLVDTKYKKLKNIQHRKFRTQMPKPPEHTDGDLTNHGEDTVSEVASTAGEDKDDSVSVMSESASEAKPSPVKQKGKRGRKPKNKGKKKKEEPPPPQEEEEEEEEANLSEADLADLEDNEDDEKLTQDELAKKIEKTSKQLSKRRDDMIHINNCLRGNDLGQDRYRRRYWHLAHADGVFVEGMESIEPWKMPYKGMPHVEKTYVGDEEESDDEIPEKKPKFEANGDDEKENVKEEEEEIDDVEDDALADEETKKRIETELALKKLGSDILVTPKMEMKDQDFKKSTPRITPNAEKLNLFNHSAHFNMSLSPMVLNGSVTITPKAEHSLFATSSPMIDNGHVSTDKPWFSILPLSRPSDNSGKFDELRRASFSSPDAKTAALLQAQCPVNPQIAMLELQLEQLKKTNVCNERKEIPDNESRGWWRITEPNQVQEIEKSLSIRGAREQQLQQNMKRTFDEVLADPNKKTLGEDLELEPLEPDSDDDEDLPELLEGGAAPPDVPGKWSYNVALRVDKYILEQVEALEDKVQSASMQVPVSSYEFLISFTV